MFWMSSMLGTVGLRSRSKYNHLIFQTTSRLLFIADNGEQYSKRNQICDSFTVRYVVGDKAQSVRNLPCMQIIVIWAQAS